MTKESLQDTLLKQAIDAFNYPEEWGDKVDEYIVQLNELREKAEKGTAEEKIIGWLSEQLVSHILEEVGEGKATAYSKVRLTSKTGEVAAIEAFNFQKEIWEKINF